MSEGTTYKMMLDANKKMEETEIAPRLFLAKEVIKSAETEGLLFTIDGKKYISRGMKLIEVIEKETK